MKRVGVVFDIPLEKSFDYLPGDFEENIRPGMRVQVPFGQRRKTGMVVPTDGEKIFREEDCKNIIRVYDPAPVITRELFSVADFLSSRYFSSLGQALFSIAGGLPSRYPSPSFKESKSFKARGEGFRKKYILLGREADRFERNREIVESLSGGSAVVLFPEVALAESFYERMEALYGEKAAIFHGELSPREKAKSWMKMLSGEKIILAGTRLAAFAPMKDINAFIFNSGHDSSFREQQTPKYDASEVACFRAKLSKIPVVFIDTCLSADQYFYANEPGANLEKAGEAPVRKNIYIIHATKKNGDKNLSFLSRDTVSLLEETVLRGGRAAIIHNSRGSSRILVCEKCEGRFSCPQCDSSLVLSEDGKNLLCRFCKTVRPFDKKCPSCGSKKVSLRLYGLEKMFKVLREVYPSVPISRVSASTAGDIDEGFSILLGTKAIRRYAGRYPFTLVIFVNGEIFLNMPDYRSEEKFFILVNEIAASLKEDSCRIIIQARNPFLEIYRALRENNPDIFYKKELLIRKQLGYPPFAEIVKVELKSRKASVLEARKAVLEEYFARVKSEVLYSGPSFPPVKKGRDVWKYLLRAGEGFDRDGLKKIAYETSAAVELNPERI